MLKIKLNNRVYELPLGELYKDKFNIYINNDILDLNDLDTNIKYRKTNELFDFVTKSFQMFMYSYNQEPGFKYSNKVLDITRKVEPTDHLQRFFAKNNNLDKSIEIMNKLIEEELAFYNSFIQEDSLKKTINR